MLWSSGQVLRNFSNIWHASTLASDPGLYWKKPILCREHHLYFKLAKNTYHRQRFWLAPEV